MKRRFKITKAEIGSWHTDFSMRDLDHENPDNSMGAAAFFHHLGYLAGLELDSIKGLEFTVELQSGKTTKLDPLVLCGKTIKAKSNQSLEPTQK